MCDPALSFWGNAVAVSLIVEQSRFGALWGVLVEKKSGTSFSFFCAGMDNHL